MKQVTQPKTMFTSDPHFLHSRICEFTSRKLETTQENHEEWLINIWNSQVNKCDKIYVLGDLSFHKKYEQISSIMRRLNGQIFIIKGNHDSLEDLERLKFDKLIQDWYMYKEIRLEKQPVVLFHFPIAAFHKQAHGSWHLHGHSHGSYVIPKGKILDVGLDSAYNIYGDHRFFTEQDVKEYMETREKQVVDHHVDRTGEYK
jgi:calcineurin-like phosphoesterase family protein